MKKLLALCLLTLLVACRPDGEAGPQIGGPPAEIPVPFIETTEDQKVPYETAEGLLSSWMDGAEFVYVFNAEELPVYQTAWEYGVIVFLQQGESETLKSAIVIALDEPQYDHRYQDNFLKAVLRTFISDEAYDWAVENPDPPVNEEFTRNFDTRYGPVNLQFLYDEERNSRVYTVEYE